ncbi:MAG: 1-acyl-sn-glycerol-3-phosphate acyltransferase [Lachnospira sp.]|nr:1-acyl-sn-glycerol-3-phosphate acyltransferase [Lachnospira sp.]
MLNNKKKDMTPFDMKREPMTQKWYLMPLVWGGSWIMTRQFKLKIIKKNMQGLKLPFLVVSTHQGFADYYITPLALFPHRANYVSDMEGFAAFGEWLYRAIGCIGKRRYVSDGLVVKNIKRALDKGQPVVVYPESRHSNVGATAYIPPNIGKLVKMMKVPLVILSVHGSYLANPFWDEEHTRKITIEALIECVYSAEEVAKLSAEAIQRTVEERLQYDEYRWQQENNILITEANRAEGLHKALYQCRRCGTEFSMKTYGDSLRCEKCNAKWELTSSGWLELQESGVAQKGEGDDTSLRVHIPDWYEWQRTNVIREIEAGNYGEEFKVRVEALPNAKGFVSLGEGKLLHNKEGFYLEIQGETMYFDHTSRESVQTEYNYRGRGACIVLSIKDCCYYTYSDDERFNPTKIQFAGEYYHQCER